MRFVFQKQFKYFITVHGCLLCFYCNPKKANVVPNTDANRKIRIITTGQWQALPFFLTIIIKICADACHPCAKTNRNTHMGKIGTMLAL